MKDILHNHILNALAKLNEQWQLESLPDFKIEKPKQADHGDYACNAALPLAKALKDNPGTIAQTIVDHLEQTDWIEAIQIAGPGFINFFIADKAFQKALLSIHNQKEHFGRTDLGQSRHINLEFVSINPTGPLHVGHGRNAAYGASLANLLEAVGYKVHREYYVNDAGRQINNLAVSVWCRYLAFFDHQMPFPEAGYRGHYVIDIADALHARFEDEFVAQRSTILDDTLTDADTPDSYIDGLVKRMKPLLGQKRFKQLKHFTLEMVVQSIATDLAQFNVHFDEWFHESKLVEQNAVEQGINRLTEEGWTYQKDGATWFQATHFGDSKDRVLVRNNGESTYFASDIAYHLNKLERGYDHLIDVVGADHHGYTPRIKAFLQALGGHDQYLTFIIVQFAVLYRGQQKLSMSTRGGNFVTLKELITEVGTDAARYFYIMRKPDQHLDFDLELAKAQSADNPVYYVQYAHARVVSVFNQLEPKGIAWDEENGSANLDRLTEQHERTLLRRLADYPDVIESAATRFEPHEIANYLERLATAFHTYYNACPFIVDDNDLRDARLYLIEGCRQVIQNGLTLLGVSSPKAM